MSIIFAIVIFEIIIIVHEFGHFIVAKACGVKVNEFAIGMGPAIIKFRKGETQYALRILPIGGYCSMEGEDAESEESDDAESEEDVMAIFELFKERCKDDFDFE